MWVFIAQEIMFFGGLFATYAVYRHLYCDAFAARSQPPRLEARGRQHRGADLQLASPWPWRCTSASRGKKRAIVGWLLATILLGVGVPGGEVRRVPREVRAPPGSGAEAPLRGPAPARACALHLEGSAEHAQLYFSLYFAMTGLHALHMIIGIPILAWIAWQGVPTGSSEPTTTPRWRSSASTGTSWTSSGSSSSPCST